MKETTATVISIYFPNIDDAVVKAQADCVNKYLPYGWTFRQYLHKPRGEAYSHAAALKKCIEESETDVCILLDIDAFPLNEVALAILYRGAAEGMLIGAVQRANHIENDRHLYVGPSCMAFSKKIYKILGSPSFDATSYGDIGEEITYVWENAKRSVVFLWPTSVEKPLWDLQDGKRFGIGTTYDDLFYHFFCVRDKSMQRIFIERAKYYFEKDCLVEQT